jgi:cyclopropane-fatty-acyl-phospholipid synthase
MALLEDVDRGELILEDHGERHAFGKASEPFPLRAAITVHRPCFYRKALWGGSIGAAEAYMAGDWSADDLTTVIRLMVINRHIFEKMDSRWGRFMEPVHQWFHWLNKNTRAGSRNNILAHYDLGNDFYKLFLDDTLTYSCGIFEKEASTLKEASLAKYDRICQKLDLQPSDHVLEIGTGWGGFAIHAGQHYGCRVTSTTISPSQLALAKERIDGAGLGQRVTLLLKDYRDLEGIYDKLVSIEMIEAVGHQFLETFFRCCSRYLKRDGTMLLQAITIDDGAYERHKRSVDFIKRYIFPGSCIPSLTAMCQAMARATDLRVTHLEEITPHYARTLREWRQRFFANIEPLRALGYSDTFIRMWEYYFCYCEGGFEERYLGDVQIVMAKPFCRSRPILPRLRNEAQ